MPRTPSSAPKSSAPPDEADFGETVLHSRRRRAAGTLALNWPRDDSSCSLWLTDAELHTESVDVDAAGMVKRDGGMCGGLGAVEVMVAVADGDALAA
jgi:hypothetical protein